jgi:hypothetical protein
MGPIFCFYPIVLFALVWLFLMLHGVWSSDRRDKYRPISKPLAPPRQRSKEPKPFAGLTNKPHCAVCEHGAIPPTPPSLVPPAPMPPPRRPRQVDTSHHFCPHAGCDDRG